MYNKSVNKVQQEKDPFSEPEFVMRTHGIKGKMILNSLKTISVKYHETFEPHEFKRFKILVQALLEY